jgi:hypothetical protein
MGKTSLWRYIYTTTQIIRDIRHIILHNIEVDQLFKQSDLNNNGTLDLKELETLIRIVAPNIVSYDVRRVFDKIDLDQDGRITREEVEIMLNGDQDRDPSKQYPDKQKTMH